MGTVALDIAILSIVGYNRQYPLSNSYRIAAVHDSSGDDLVARRVPGDINPPVGVPYGCVSSFPELEGQTCPNAPKPWDKEGVPFNYLE